MSTPQRPPMSALTDGDPTQVGPFRVYGRLGAGGMGVVYGATGADGRWVALKLIRGEFTDDHEFRDRFVREVDLMRRVGSRSIAPVIAADTTGDGQPWYATPYVAGPTLQQRVKDGGALRPGSTEALAAGLADAISAIHAAGVVHRDLKPANVILAEDGPKVLDFGIARAVDESAITRTGGLVGSPGWMSPERFRGHTGPEADIFAWGALVAYAATGRPPFGTGGAETLMYRVLNEDPDLDGLPAELAEPITRALAKDPTQRPAAEELVPMVARGYGLTPGDDAADVAATIIERNWTPPAPPVPNDGAPGQEPAHGTPASQPSPPRGTSGPGVFPPQPTPPRGAPAPGVSASQPSPPRGGPAPTPGPGHYAPQPTPPRGAPTPGPPVPPVGRSPEWRHVPPPTPPRPASGTSRSRVWLAVTAAIGVLVLVVGVGGVVAARMFHSAAVPSGSPSQEPGELNPALAQLDKDGVVTLGIADYEPYAFLDENGEATGRGPELARAVFEKLGATEVEVTSLEFDALQPAVMAGEVDVVAADQAIAPERCGSIAYSDPYAQFRTGFLMRDDDADDGRGGLPEAGESEELDFDTVADSDLDIGLLEGSVDQEFALESGIDQERITTGPPTGLLAQLANGGVDVVALDSVQLRWEQENHYNGDDFTFVGSMAREDETTGEPMMVALSFALEQDELVNAVNKEITTLKESGELRQITDEFGMGEDELPPEDFTAEDACA